MSYRTSIVVHFEPGVFPADVFMDFILDRGFGCYNCFVDGSSLIIGASTTRICSMDRKAIRGELEKYEGVVSISY
jgi:hypothetical protein